MWWRSLCDRLISITGKGYLLDSTIVSQKQFRDMCMKYYFYIALLFAHAKHSTEIEKIYSRAFLKSFWSINILNVMLVIQQVILQHKKAIFSSNLFIIIYTALNILNVSLLNSIRYKLSICIFLIVSSWLC